jgi:glutamyl-tRNA reductase
MKVLIAGLNHNTAAVEVREKLAFNGPKLEEGLKGLTALKEVHEAVVLSTCNRVEMYTCVSDEAAATIAIKDFISRFHNIERSLLDTSLYFYTGQEAVSHAFRVASSLDSMVVGEAQILGQLKESFEFALEKKATGVLINKLIKKAISVAKRVRTETRIAENAVNISSVAVDLSKKIFHDLNGRSVLLLGAGDMAELAARHLRTHGVTDIIVANRTHSTGCKLAEDMCGRAVKFEDFIYEMVSTDIVVCSTGASEYILTHDQMKNVMKLRKQKPIFLIDISVPRNIDPKVNDLDNIYLYDVDDLQGVADAGLEERKKEAEKGEEIVKEEIESFLRWLSSLDAKPTIIALREHAEKIKRQEISKLNGKLEGLSPEQRKAVEQLASSIINKLVHPPTAALKEDAEDKDELIAMVKRLYGLD